MSRYRYGIRDRFLQVASGLEPFKHMSAPKTKTELQTALLRLGAKLPQGKTTVDELRKLYQSAVAGTAPPPAVAARPSRKSEPLPTLSAEPAGARKRTLPEGEPSTSSNARKRASTPSSRRLPKQAPPPPPPIPPPPPYPPPPLPTYAETQPAAPRPSTDRRRSFGNVPLHEQHAAELSPQVRRQSYGNVPLSSQQMQQSASPAAPLDSRASSNSFGNLPLGTQQPRASGNTDFAAQRSPPPLGQGAWQSPGRSSDHTFSNVPLGAQQDRRASWGTFGNTPLGAQQSPSAPISQGDLPVFAFGDTNGGETNAPTAPRRWRCLQVTRRLACRLLSVSASAFVLVWAVMLARMQPSVGFARPLREILDPAALSEAASSAASLLLASLSSLWVAVLSGCLSLLNPIRIFTLLGHGMGIVFAFVYRYPSTVLSLSATVFALTMIFKGYRYVRSWREARKLAQEQMVDDAALWIVTELRAYHQAWTRASGSGRQLGASDLRRRIPRHVLPDHKLWKQVVAKVSADESVQVITSQAGDISWRFHE